MSNFVFYDFETSSSNKQWGQIIEVGAILVDDELNELDRFESRCRLSPGRYEKDLAALFSQVKGGGGKLDPWAYCTLYKI